MKISIRHQKDLIPYIVHIRYSLLFLLQLDTYTSPGDSCGLKVWTSVCSISSTHTQVASFEHLCNLIQQLCHFSHFQFLLTMSDSLLNLLTLFKKKYATHQIFRQTSVQLIPPKLTHSRENYLGGGTGPQGGGDRWRGREVEEDL